MANLTTQLHFSSAHGHPWDGRPGFDLLEYRAANEQDLSELTAHMARWGFKPWLMGFEDNPGDPHHGLHAGALYKPSGIEHTDWQDSGTDPYPATTEPDPIASLLPVRAAPVARPGTHRQTPCLTLPGGVAEALAQHHRAQALAHELALDEGTDDRMNQALARLIFAEAHIQDGQIHWLMPQVPLDERQQGLVQRLVAHFDQIWGSPAQASHGRELSPDTWHRQLQALARGLAQVGWHVRDLELDLRESSPHACLSVECHRSDGRWIWARMDALGRCVLESFQRSEALGMSDEMRGRRPLSRLVSDRFIGRMSAPGPRALMRTLLHYIADNPAPDAEQRLTHGQMRQLWAPLMSQRIESLPSGLIDSDDDEATEDQYIPAP